MEKNARHSCNTATKEYFIINLACQTHLDCYECITHILFCFYLIPLRYMPTVFCCIRFPLLVAHIGFQTQAHHLANPTNQILPVHDSHCDINSSSFN